MNVHPDALSQNVHGNQVSVLVFQGLWASGIAPKAIAAPMRMLRQRPCPNSQFRHILDPLGIIDAQELIGLIKAFEQPSRAGPGYVLRAHCFPETHHRVDSLRAEGQQKLFERLFDLGPVLLADEDVYLLHNFGGSLVDSLDEGNGLVDYLGAHVERFEFDREHVSDVPKLDDY